MCNAVGENHAIAEYPFKTMSCVQTLVWFQRGVVGNVVNSTELFHSVTSTIIVPPEGICAFVSKPKGTIGAAGDARGTW